MEFDRIGCSKDILGQITLVSHLLGRLLGAGFIEGKVKPYGKNSHLSDLGKAIGEEYVSAISS